MLGDIPVFDITLKAAADLSTYQYKAVKLDANGNAVAAVSGDGLFLLQNTPPNNGAASVRVHGISFAVAGAAVAVGVRVMSDANAKIVAATTGQKAIGISLKAAATADEIIPVLCDRSVLA